MLIVGTAIGGLFAAFAFAISVFAVPMLLDRRVDALTAMGTSMKLVWNNLAPMIAWGAMVLLLFAVCVATGLVGMIVIFPLLGHATWHAYRAVAPTEVWAMSCCAPRTRSRLAAGAGARDCPQPRSCSRAVTSATACSRPTSRFRRPAARPASPLSKAPCSVSMAYCGARVNLTSRRVAVKWRGAKARPPPMIDALKAIGYDAFLAESDGRRRRSRDVAAAARNSGGRLRRHEHHAPVGVGLVRRRPGNPTRIPPDLRPARSARSGLFGRIFFVSAWNSL